MTSELSAADGAAAGIAGARIGVITFPGTLDDVDAARAVRYAGAEAVALWHADDDLRGVDAVIVPGGFSYGDYLRAGAISAHATVMRSVIDAARGGMPVLGICNGFQVLTEAGLLPGALMRNAGQTFVCRTAALRVENSQSLFTSAYESGQVINVPVAHHDGNYFADEDTLDRIEGEGRVAFRYAEQVNGSLRDIAGVLNDAGNVLGMMPHPERAIEAAHGGSDGRALFESAVRGLVAA